MGENIKLLLSSDRHDDKEPVPGSPAAEAQRGAGEVRAAQTEGSQGAQGR